MRSRLAGIVALFGALFMVIGTGLTLSAAAAAPGEKVQICHKTGPDKFQSIGVDQEAIKNLPNGHDTHDDDIIPPFDGYAGKNWNEGLAIYNNGCKVPSEPEPDVEVTPTAPTSSDPCGTSGDTYTVPATAGVDYLVGGSVVTAGSYPGSGSVTVTAAATAGYQLTGDSSWTFDFTDAACEQPDEDESVTAKAPSKSDPCGTAEDAYAVPETTGVDYLVGGSVATAGSYPGSGSVTITAAATAGYQLTGDSSWTFDFTDAACEQEPGEEEPGEEKPGEDTPPSDNDSADKDSERVTKPDSGDHSDTTSENDSNDESEVGPAAWAKGSGDDTTSGSGDESAAPSAGVGVPTAVDAGLTASSLTSSTTSHGEVGLGLLGLGLALMAIAGLVRTGQRRECLQ